MANTTAPYVSPEQETRNHINCVSKVLYDCAPGHPHIPWYQRTLDDLHRKLADYQQGESSAMAANHTPPYAPTPSPASVDFPPPVSSARKHSLGPAEGPALKRISAHPSPRTPGTPDSLFDAPVVQKQWPLPSRPSCAGPARSSNSAPFVDLTVSDPPSPDPFPELDNAYRDDGVRTGPADAFTQEWMHGEDLAQFLFNPTPANGGYAFQQQQLLPAVPQALVPAPGQPPVGFGFPTREVPYLPGPERPAWLPRDDDDDGEYGHFPLNVTEADAIEKMLETIEQHGNEDSPDDREQTPRIMKSNLHEYQKIGLTWLLKMENGRAKGGILADEMGLGKTVQALALIAARPSQDPLCRTTLIIAPVALMRQWEKEIGVHIKERHKLSTYLYWGKGKKADFHQLRQHDVVLTTFGTLTSEFKQKDSRRETMLYEREKRELGFRRKPQDKLALLGHECMWYRVIIDEAHMIKNRNAISSKATVDLQAKYRLCLTGTPMMNSIDELYPLLRFLKVDRYSDWRMFAQDIAKPAKHNHQDTRKKAINRVQIVLKTIMLRRQKTSEVDGKPIIILPPKHIALDNVEFSDDEHGIYKALETKSQIQFNKYLEKDTVSANYACILVLLLRLRQACCHPHLIKDLSQPATEGIAEDDLLERARYLSDEVVQRLKDHDSFECPICFEADPNPTIIIPCGHTVCGECVQKLIDPARSGQEANDETSAAKCPHCRGALKAKLITDFKHFLRVYMPERLDPDDRVEDESDSDDEEDEEEEEEEEVGDDVDAKGNLAGFIVYDEEVEDETENDDTGSTSGGSARPAPKAKARNTVKGTGKGKARAQPKKTLAELKKESLSNKAAKKKYLRRLEKTWKPSAKILKTVELLSDIRKNDPTEKTLIFSQFTSLLDLVEVPLQQNKFRYQRFDGSMTMDDRADAVEAFMENPEENIMLVSLKAGNAGLNLSRASQVIILDPFWNPFVEDQAVDRAHRMPQQREVTVHRVLVPETVEDRICALQDKKRDIIGQALDEGVSKKLTRLNVRELKYLFGLG